MGHTNGHSNAVCYGDFTGGAWDTLIDSRRQRGKKNAQDVGQSYKKIVCPGGGFLCARRRSRRRPRRRVPYAVPVGGPVARSQPSASPWTSAPVPISYPGLTFPRLGPALVVHFPSPSLHAPEPRASSVFFFFLHAGANRSVSWSDVPSRHRVRRVESDGEGQGQRHTSARTTPGFLHRHLHQHHCLIPDCDWHL